MRHSITQRKVSAPVAPPAVAEILADHLPMLRKYMGETKFHQLAHDVALAHIGKTVAHLAKATPAFLRQHPDFKHCPELAELAQLQLAFHFAIEAPPQLLVGDISNAVRNHPFRLVASAQLLCFSQNTSSIWSALTAHETPPKPHHLGAEQYILVWRQGEIPRFRLLGAEEAELIEALKSSALPETTNPAQRQRYIEGWITADLLELADADFLK